MSANDAGARRSRAASTLDGLDTCSIRSGHQADNRASRRPQRTRKEQTTPSPGHHPGRTEITASATEPTRKLGSASTWRQQGTTSDADKPWRAVNYVCSSRTSARPGRSRSEINAQPGCVGRETGVLLAGLGQNSDCLVNLRVVASLFRCQLPCRVQRSEGAASVTV